ncbi:hypothetical protein BBO99_00007983 [Phytophthora kernoviae]|uniref:Macro domain-containing protein n=2 Tax=Phytophthora kernoviae TaxID=325452 RepID=A0A3R7MJV7_9STRA|nr:hypothetical protein G195_009044 [Phytophthora kernoviae 00238/432]KAG2516587.1 hypothetical protein JM16_007601 [Phytophthora kernoviae]KAG2519488.1 hypothetical protein JM18_007526 [Phytophthora kernoviae]RLM96150.1 hypothetical protein BBI17_007937 [Phytophthora kernoviae]RLN75893.1 hypothetical protein BBO99_00007983 [Phytophthora kernoviae]
MAKLSGLAGAMNVVGKLEKNGVTAEEKLEKALDDPKIIATNAVNGKESMDNVAAKELGGKVLCRWKPNGDPGGPELLVMQGDLTACKADAIVNAANTRLMHGGGLAGAIVRKGGESIQTESSAWIKQHGKLVVGDAVATAAGKLPCKHVIHAAGPNVGHLASPTAEHAAELRRAVWSALTEADRLGVSSVAIPGISTGIFGYPRDLGAQEIVHEAVRFSRQPAGGVIYGLQSKAAIGRWPGNNPQQFALVDTKRNLYCSVMNVKKVVAKDLKPNCWYHLALTYDVDLHRQEVYVNGENVWSEVGELRSRWPYLRHEQIGTGFCENHPSAGGIQYPHPRAWGAWYPLYGLIDEFRVWKSALPAKAVAELALGGYPDAFVVVGTIKRVHDGRGPWTNTTTVRCTRPAEGKNVIIQ